MAYGRTTLVLYSELLRDESLLLGIPALLIAFALSICAERDMFAEAKYCIFTWKRALRGARGQQGHMGDLCYETMSEVQRFALMGNHG